LFVLGVPAQIAAAAVIAALQDGTITGHGTAAHLFRTHQRQPGSPFATHF
jgi:hypothetical protein